MAWQLGMPVSIVGRGLRRLVLGELAALEPKARVACYPRELIHIDIKKLGRIEAFGHRITGDPRDRRRGTGWEYVHVCIDRRLPTAVAPRRCGGTSLRSRSLQVGSMPDG